MSIEKVWATGLAYDPATRDWTEPVLFETRDYTAAMNWVRFNRDWIKDLRIDGQPIFTKVR